MRARRGVSHVHAGTVHAPDAEIALQHARDLFTRYLLQFEIVGLLLLVAVVAATVVARKPPAAPTGAPGAASPVSEVEP